MSASTLPDIAETKLLSGYNCAQAVLYASCDRLGFDKDTAQRIACGFGAGMARQEEVCGAVTGGIMAIGLKHGRGEGEDKSRTEEAYTRIQQLMQRFRDRHGSVICRELIGCNLLTPAGQEFFKSHDLLHRTCAPCVRTAAEIVDTLI
ncbi:hypothetical protein DB347_19900 [Opitutaceae bacterium EW11]|nr:hypothetical protein DB347_19900 [Opitutaceae bacterium EW11]